MNDTEQRRRFFAEEIQAIANLRSEAVVEALASVPREQFLPAGPWLVRAELQASGQPRLTLDADPKHVYHNYAVVIDATRHLINGVPSLLCSLIDALALEPTQRVLHIGAGLGYYTAIMAHVVGRSGRVVAVEVDRGLAAQAGARLSAMPWVSVQAGDGTSSLDEPFDAMLVNAGVTHPQPIWLDRLKVGGRLIMPLTTALPSATIGRGVMALFTKRTSEYFDARTLASVAIYSGVQLRDDSLNEQLAKVLRRQPYPQLTSMRCDPHTVDDQCWLHGAGFCIAKDPGQAMSGAATRS